MQQLTNLQLHTQHAHSSHVRLWCNSVLVQHPEYALALVELVQL